VFLTALVLNTRNALSHNDPKFFDISGTNSAQLSKFSVAALFKTSGDYNSDAFVVNKAGAPDNLNYGIWMNGKCGNIKGRL